MKNTVRPNISMEEYFLISLQIATEINKTIVVINWPEFGVNAVVL